MNYYPSLSLSHVTADSVGQEHQQRTAWDGILERASLPKWENLHTSPAFAPFVPTGAQCDMQLEATWPPAANMLIGFACQPLGAEQPLAGYGCHLMTPQSVAPRPTGLGISTAQPSSDYPAPLSYLWTLTTRPAARSPSISRGIGTPLPNGP